MIISTIKAYIDQNMATQTNLINKLNERLDLCFNQLNNKEQTSQPSNTNLQHSNIAPLTHNHEFNLAQHEKNNNTHNTNQQSNCPLTPILNNLIISSNSHGATQEAAHTTFTTNASGQGIHTAQFNLSHHITASGPPVL
ncbi:4630_t:CDS:2, partial [Racocetra fulgida]